MRFNLTFSKSSVITQGCAQAVQRQCQSIFYRWSRQKHLHMYGPHMGLNMLNHHQWFYQPNHHFSSDGHHPAPGKNLRNYAPLRSLIRLFLQGHFVWNHRTDESFDLTYWRKKARTPWKIKSRCCFIIPGLCVLIHQMFVSFSRTQRYYALSHTLSFDMLRGRFLL